MPNSISDLPDVSKIEDSKSYLLDGKGLRAIVESLRQLWNGENVGRGPNIRLRRNGMGGYTVTGADQSALSTSPPLAPFAVSVKGSQKTGFQAKVNLQSDLLLSLTPNDFQGITGLDSWFPLIANDLIWLHVDIDTGTVTDATIKSYGQGDGDLDPTADPYDVGGYVQNDGATPPNQTELMVMLAYTTPDSKGNPYLVQACFDHLVLEPSCISGITTLIAVPSTYRRYGVTAPL